MELLNIYDDNGNKTGRIIERGDKSVKLSKNEHIAISVIFIENDNGEFLIQKTSKEKGNIYSSTGGHVDSGETPITAIKREVKEELGIDISNDLIEEYGYILYDMPLRYIFYLKKNIDLNDVKLQKEEVDYVKYMTKEEIQKLIDNKKMLESHGIMFKELMKKRNNLITNAKDYLGKIVTVKIDRALGTKHPKHGFIYTVNYGYIEGTISGDGEELDAYVLGVFEPCTEFTGRVISYIHRTNDNDDKLIVVPNNREFSNKEIEALTEFQERFFEHEIIRENIEFNSLIPELSVSNIDISKKFYIDLGFQVRYERKEDKFCFLQLEENQIMIEEDNNNWNTGKLEYPYGRGINISMTISDVEKMYNKLKEKDIKFFLDLEVHEYRVNDEISLDKEFLVQDPDGYLLRFNN